MLIKNEILDLVSICIDDQIPPFSFVTIFGTAKIFPYIQKEILKWATKIAERYMGKRNAEATEGTVVRAQCLYE